ncbi:TonB-dependent receptor [Calditrichota bacterium LG25]
MRTLLLFFVFVFTLSLFAQNQSGQITGVIIKTDSDERLSNVIVRIESKNRSTKSDENGEFILEDVPPGNYYLIFIKKGFYSLVIPEVKVKAGKVTALNVTMYPGNENEFLFLEIGGIQVTAQRDLLPQEPETIHRISSGEIEHMQATSLADVLEMIPGNEKATNLGLQSKQKINLRNFGDAGSAFGTKIILDDVPLSNNVDLQTGVGVNYGTKVQASAESQYDLREIVADNLQRVEVQSGATSVEYGDNTSGVIIATTRTENVPTRIKIKNNPDTKEANLMGSFKRWNTNFVYNLNYGYSERDIRIKGDEFHRIGASLKAKNYFLQKKIELTQGLRFSRKIEEDNDESDPNKTRAYNRDFHITYSQRINFKQSKNTTFYMRNFLDYKRRNSWRHKLETRDLGYATTLMEPGTIEGIFADPVYFSDVRTIGDEWALGFKVKFNHRFFTGKFLHRILAGGEYQKEWNSGPGKQFDILYPPNGGGNVRPRSFSDIPGISQLSVFLEDRITARLIVPATLNLGLRIDSYNPDGFSPFNLINGEDVFKARQGTFLNPRLGLKLKLFKHTQFRLTFSKASKTPALSMLYPENFYLDVNDVGIMHQTLDDGRDTTITVPLISTYVYNRTNANLNGYQSTKYEVGLDQRIGDFALSFNGFLQKTNNIPQYLGQPLTYYRYEWPQWPDESQKTVMEKVLIATSGYKIAHNVGWVNNSGIEFLLRTHRLPKLNIRFFVSASYVFSRSGKKDGVAYFSSASRSYSAGDTLASGWVVPEDMKIVPYYKPTTSWRQKTIINYKIDYIARSLGIWLTFRAQQVLWDRYLLLGNVTTHAIGYYKDGQLIPIDPQTSTLMGLDRSYNELDTSVDDSKPNDKWLFSVIVSKSLFKGAEISLFVENIFNDMAYYKTRYGSYSARNPEMFWGVAFSAKLDGLFKK